MNKHVLVWPKLFDGRVHMKSMGAQGGNKNGTGMGAGGNIKSGNGRGHGMAHSMQGMPRYHGNGDGLAWNEGFGMGSGNRYGGGAKLGR